MFIHRALNYSRKSFMPTYVGLRYMLDQLPRERLHGFIRKMIEKKGRVFSEDRYRSYTYYKSSSRDGSIEYRICSAPSPTAMLIESYLLEQLGQVSSFQPSSNVYSYTFPSPRSASIFNYFYSGYLDRSRAIQASMTADHDNVAVLVDIRKFYPTIIKEDVRGSLNFLLSENKFPKTTKKVLEAVTSGFLSGPKKGLPIGPPMSHFFANLALRDVDIQLSRSFPNRYSRYVDDICVVTPARRSEAAIKRVTQIIEEAGYHLNSSKTCVISDLSYFSQETKLTQYSMSVLRSAIIVYLSLKPRNFSLLSRALRSVGCNIPVQMLALSSTAPGWKKYLAVLLQQGDERKEVALALRGRNSIVRYAQRLREHTAKQANDLFESHIFVIDRKNYIKKMRRLLMNMIYLTPLSEMEMLVPFCKDALEMDELRVLFQACARGNIDELIWFPGSITDVFSQVWTGAGLSSPSIMWPKKLAAPQRDSIAKLVLTGIIDAPRDAPLGIDKRFRQFLSGEISDGPIRSSYDYEDEVFSLRAGSPEIKPTDFIKGRFDELEQLPFYAFGGEYYGQ